MLIQWYADIEGDDSKIIPRVVELTKEVNKTVGGRLLGGPYRPQTASLLLLEEYDSIEQFQKAGKLLLDRAQREGLPVTPIRYEVAFGVGEAGGP